MFVSKDQKYDSLMFGGSWVSTFSSGSRAFNFTSGPTGLGSILSARFISSHLNFITQKHKETLDAYR